MDLTHLLQYKPALLLFMAVIGWPLISATLNIMLRKKTPEEWETWALSKPLSALGVELMRALGFDLKKALVAFQRYAQRKAGQIPEDAAAIPGLPPVIVSLLNDPAKLRMLEQAAQTIAASRAPSEPPAPISPQK